MTIFQQGNFKLSSGAFSRFKIECDALTNDDWAALAEQIAMRCPPFCDAIGVKRGGVPLARALYKYRSSPTQGLLLVDDVLTTGRSILDLMKKYERYNPFGWVVFARNECPFGVKALFQLASLYV